MGMQIAGGAHLDHIVGIAMVGGHQPAAAEALHRLQQLPQARVAHRHRADDRLQVAGVPHLRFIFGFKGLVHIAFVPSHMRPSAFKPLPFAVLVGVAMLAMTESSVTYSRRDRNAKLKGHRQCCFDDHRVQCTFSFPKPHWLVLTSVKS